MSGERELVPHPHDEQAADERCDLQLASLTQRRGCALEHEDRDDAERRDRDVCGEPTVGSEDEQPAGGEKAERPRRELGMVGEKMDATTPAFIAPAEERTPAVRVVVPVASDSVGLERPAGARADEVGGQEREEDEAEPRDPSHRTEQRGIPIELQAGTRRASCLDRIHLRNIGNPRPGPYLGVPAFHRGGNRVGGPP